MNTNMNTNTNTNNAPNQRLREKKTDLVKQNKIMADLARKKYHQLVALAKRYCKALENKDSVVMRKTTTALKNMVTSHIGQNHLWYSIKVDRVDISINVLPVMDKGRLIRVDFWHENHTSRHIKMDATQDDLQFLSELFRTLQW